MKPKFMHMTCEHRFNPPVYHGEEFLQNYMYYGGDDEDTNDVTEQDKATYEEFRLDLDPWEDEIEFLD